MWGLVNGNDLGWTSTQTVVTLGIGALLIAAFVAWEARTDAPMIPLRLFRSRAFTAANIVSMLMTFGMFGSIFLLAQFFQVVQGYSPLEAGLRTLPWTFMPVIVAPIAGLISTRTGTRPLLVLGMALQAAGLAWLSVLVTPTVEYLTLVPAFVMAGAGMGLFFAPIANVVLSAVRPEEEGKASGANNAIRELGGVFGVAVLAAVFTANGSYVSPVDFVEGLVPSMQLGAVGRRPRCAGCPGPAGSSAGHGCRDRRRSSRVARRRGRGADGDGVAAPTSSEGPDRFAGPGLSLSAPGQSSVRPLRAFPTQIIASEITKNPMVTATAVTATWP